jgi:phenylalanyl-tRNA synthetase beta chain
MLDTVTATIAQNPSLSVVQDARLFDVWRDKQDMPGASREKSLALRFWLQDNEKTLDDTRVDACMAIVRDALVAGHGARLRT